MQLKSQIFALGVGGDQNRANSNVNIGITVIRLLKTRLQVNANVASTAGCVKVHVKLDRSKHMIKTGVTKMKCMDIFLNSTPLFSCLDFGS